MRAAPAFADAGGRRAIRVEIGDEREELHDVLGRAARLAHDRDDVVERLEELRREVGLTMRASLSHAIWPGDVERCAALREDAVRVAARLREMRRRDDLVCHDPLSLSLPIRDAVGAR